MEQALGTVAVLNHPSPAHVSYSEAAVGATSSDCEFVLSCGDATLSRGGDLGDGVDLPLREPDVKTRRVLKQQCNSLMVPAQLRVRELLSSTMKTASAGSDLVLDPGDAQLSLRTTWS